MATTSSPLLSENNPFTTPHKSDELKTRLGGSMKALKSRSTRLPQAPHHTPLATTSLPSPLRKANHTGHLKPTTLVLSTESQSARTRKHFKTLEAQFQQERMEYENAWFDNLTANLDSAVEGVEHNAKALEALRNKLDVLEGKASKDLVSVSEVCEVLTTQVRENDHETQQNRVSLQALQSQQAQGEAIHDKVQALEERFRLLQRAVTARELEIPKLQQQLRKRDRLQTLIMVVMVFCIFFGLFLSPFEPHDGSCGVGSGFRPWKVCRTTTPFENFL